MFKTREYTNKILDLVEEGMFDKDALIRDLLHWLSEDDVKELYLTHYATEEEEEDSL